MFTSLLLRLRDRLTKGRATALLEQAHARWAAGDRDGCVAACRQALQLQPRRPMFRDELAHALTYKHDYWLNPEQCARLCADGTLDEAITLWRSALELGWQSHWTELCLGHALTAKGDFAAAARHLARAIDLKTAQHYPEHVARYGEQGVRKGPDFILIGATKCGTTSLYEYMRHHPQVLPAIWKEIEYFRFPQRGRDWYLSHFPRIPHGDTRFVSGEASTCYMSIWDAKTRVHAEFPAAKLIALVRDPVAKAISHAHHDRKIGCEHRTAEQALTEELDILEALERPWHDAEEYWKTQRGYVWLSLYAYFLENWLTVFPREQLLVIPSEELYGEPGPTLSRVYAHLDLPDHQLDDYEVHLKGSYDRERSPLQERLARFFAPHNQRLFELLGRELPWTRPTG